jgi:MHS family proline/betaine transporter-like MFS transporter
VPFLVAARSASSDVPAVEDGRHAGVPRAGAEDHETEETAGTKLKEVLTGYMPQLLKLSGLVIALNVVNYTLLSYSPTYLRPPSTWTSKARSSCRSSDSC